jgi:hypothetical protein
MRTLKQIVTRINQLATSHQLINQVGFGTKEDLDNLVKQGLTYPMCFIEVKKDIATSRTDKLQRFNFSLFFFDIQNVLSEARTNVLEVKSDLVSIATDLLAMLQRDIDVTENQDWIVSPSTTLNMDEYQISDLCVGVELPIQVGLRYAADRCHPPVGAFLARALHLTKDSVPALRVGRVGHALFPSFTFYCWHIVSFTHHMSSKIFHTRYIYSLSKNDLH